MEPVDSTTERIDRLEQAVQYLEQANQAMADRLARSEHHAQSRRRILGLLAVVAVFTFLTARAVNTARTMFIEAEQFTLMDKDGNRRAILYMAPEGYPVLAFYDRDEHALLDLYAWNENAVGMDVYDKKGNIRLGIGGAKGGVSMAIYEGSGKKRAVFGMTESGSTGMEIFDRDGMIRIEDYVYANGTAERFTARASPLHPMSEEEDRREKSEGE